MIEGGDLYFKGFFDAITPEWTAFTFDDGKQCAVFCHLFGARVQYIVRTDLMDSPYDAGVWGQLQRHLMRQCAEFLIREGTHL